MKEEDKAELLNRIVVVSSFIIMLVGIIFLYIFGGWVPTLTLFSVIVVVIYLLMYGPNISFE